MSNSTANIYDLIADNQTALFNIGTSEYPTAALTLTRTATLALTTAGTTITWQSAVRNLGVSWSGTTVTVPTDGYYNIAVTVALSISTTLYVRFVYNTINSQVGYTPAPFTTGGGFVYSTNFCAYLQGGLSFTIVLVPGANCTLNLNGETLAAPSPFLHLVQLSGSYE